MLGDEGFFSFQVLYWSDIKMLRGNKLEFILIIRVQKIDPDKELSPLWNL